MKTTHWFGGLPSFIDADKHRWAKVSIPSSKQISDWKKSSKFILDRTVLTTDLFMFETTPHGTWQFFKALSHSDTPSWGGVPESDWMQASVSSLERKCGALGS